MFMLKSTHAKTIEELERGKETEIKMLRFFWMSKVEEALERAAQATEQLLEVREKDSDSTLAAYTEYLLECIERPPEANCSCHISPPCNDCVNYSSLREAIANCEEALKNFRKNTGSGNNE